MVLEQSHADTDHRVEATALKVMALSSGTAYTSGGAHTRQWLSSRGPLKWRTLLSLSFAVRHGHSWSHMSESKRCSTDKLYVCFMNIMYDTTMHIASAYIKVCFVWNIVGKCVFVYACFFASFPFGQTMLKVYSILSARREIKFCIDSSGNSLCGLSML